MAPAAVPAGGDEPVEATRRDEILAIAAKLFAATGYTGTSLSDVADAAGILPGSLYHHFESKEALAVELVLAFHDETRRAARDFDPPADPLGALREFTRSMTSIAYRHQAAVQLCVYDAPTSVGTRYRDVVARRPAAVHRRWRDLVEEAGRTGALRSAEADGRLLGYALRRGSASVALLPMPRIQPVDWSDCMTAVMLDGLVPDCPPLAELDRSAAARVAREVVAEWRAQARERDGSRREEILDAARREFARRGFEATTMRDVAAAANTRASSIYRHFDSKATMLLEIIDRYSHQLLSGFRDVVDAGGSPTESLAGLIELMVHAGRTFQYEFDIIKAWWQLVSPSSPDFASEDIRVRFTLLRDIVDRGTGCGELRGVTDDHDLLSMCVRDVLWMPQWGSNKVTPQRAVRFLRECMLVGAAARA